MSLPEPTADLTVDAAPDFSDELHVFHYRTHSLVWTLTLRHLPGCSSYSEHVHAPDGRDVFVFCSVYLTRDGAEQAVAVSLAQHAEFGDVLGPVEVIRHRDDAPHPAGTETAG
jgi:hypothetical protein